MHKAFVRAVNDAPQRREEPSKRLVRVQVESLLLLKGSSGEKEFHGILASQLAILNYLCNCLPCTSTYNLTVCAASASSSTLQL